MKSPIEMMYEFINEMDYANLPTHLKEKYFRQLLTIQNSTLRLMYSKAYLEGQKGDSFDPDGAVAFFYDPETNLPEQNKEVEGEVDSPKADGVEIERETSDTEESKSWSMETVEDKKKWVSKYYAKRIADVIVKHLDKKELQRKVLTFISKNSSPYGGGYSDYITRHRILSNFKSEKGVDKPFIAELLNKRFISQLHFKIKITHLGMAELEKK